VSQGYKQRGTSLQSRHPDSSAHFANNKFPPPIFCLKATISPPGQKRAHVGVWAPFKSWAYGPRRTGSQAQRRQDSRWVRKTCLTVREIRVSICPHIMHTLAGPCP